MEITNEHNLPDAVYNALAANHYVPGDNDFSATGLLNPPQQTELIRRHNDSITIDAMSNLYSVLGSAMHNMLEQHTDSEVLSEKRLYLTGSVDDTTYKIGGQIDYYHAGVLRDYKVTSVFSYAYGSRFKHWEQQLDIYSTLLKLHKYPVKHQEICMIFRDWSPTKARLDKGYPKTPIISMAFPVKNPGLVLEFIQKRLARHVYARTLSDADLATMSPCSDNDMWRKPTTYALIKKGRTKAMRVMDDKDKLKQWAAERHLVEPSSSPNTVRLNRSFYIQERPGECTRCVSWCYAKDFCHQYQEIRNKELEVEKQKQDAKKISKSI